MTCEHQAAFELPGDRFFCPSERKADSVTFKREDVNDAFDIDWCPRCGKITEHTNFRLGLPGIDAHKCNECGLVTEANFLEDWLDLIFVPKSFTMPTKDVVTEHKNLISQALNKIFKSSLENN